jgi:hypothetical protein
MIQVSSKGLWRPSCTLVIAQTPPAIFLPGVRCPLPNTHGAHCAECGRGFKWKQALISHALVHSDEKRHLCDTCGYTTAHHSSFRAHKLVHAGVSWSCPQPGCHFVATRKQSLAHHIPTHTNQRHYQCEVYCTNCNSCDSKILVNYEFMFINLAAVKLFLLLSLLLCQNLF